MTATFETFAPAGSPAEDTTAEYTAELLDKLFAAAQPGAVFSAPVVAGDYTIITASEISTGGGFGSGKGFGPASRPTGETPAKPDATIGGGSGMGGGGGASGRPLAAIIIGPDGVRVQPVVDATKIGLAALAAFGTIFATMLKIRRALRKAEAHHK